MIYIIDIHIHTRARAKKKHIFNTIVNIKIKYDTIVNMR